MKTPIGLFATTQLDLLATEHAADVSSSTLATTAASVSPATRRTLQATGLALTGVVLSQCRTGMGGRVVGEFVSDSASSGSGKSGKDKDAGDDGTGAAGQAHGIRVGDVVRVNEITGRKPAKDSGKGAGAGAGSGSDKTLEGVVTRVGEKGVWIAFGQRGGSGSGGGSGSEDDAIEQLWGKKLWLYVYSCSRGSDMRDLDKDWLTQTGYEESNWPTM